NSTIVLQHPFHVKHFCRFRILKQLKQKKKIKIISIVHDVEELRGLFTKTYYSVEFNQMIALADSLIVHNEVMLDWFVSKGIEKTKLVNLEIFDYLNDKILKPNRDISKKIIIAGNLSKTKSPYIYMLKELKDIEVDLFGINYEQSFESENITYKGAFPAEQVPFELNEGLGLVWDGDKLDECSGATGNYLRYNNPHKLSLYLSSGRPVIVWSKSAEAKFVEENNIGFAVDSLFD
ncbi:TPA: glycosyl transferase, partial [Streptococcus suis]